MSVRHTGAKAECEKVEREAGAKDEFEARSKAEHERQTLETKNYARLI